MRCITTMFLLATSFSALAGDLTIPNTFQPNTPARAADVNANFTAVEASVDDNAANIAANVADIASNAAAINALPNNAGMQIYSGGISIGRLISIKSFNTGTLLIQSDMGYLYESDIAGSGHLLLGNSFYSEPNCVGTLYTFHGLDWTGSIGLVVRVDANNEAYYWPRGSTPVPVTLVSQLHPDGTCQDGLSWTTIAAAVIPNDEAITGVPNVKPNWPFTLSPQ